MKILTPFFFFATIILSSIYPFLLYDHGGVSKNKAMPLLSPQDLSFAKRSFPRRPTNTFHKDNTTASTFSTNLAPNNDTYKPLFIIHVGPEKTGATTIQSIASNHEEELLKDDIYYLGHGRKPEWNLHQLFTFCAATRKQARNIPKCQEEWKALKKRIQDHYIQNHTVFLSEELFSGLGNDDMREVLWTNLMPLKKKWNVHIIVTYKRFYEWLPSRYYERYNPSQERIPKARARAKMNWPTQGGRNIETFPTFVDRILEHLDLNNPIRLLQMWQEHFDTVQVFNLHDESNSTFVPINFFCTMIPQARHTCQHLKQHHGVAEMRNSSSSTPLHYDMIAMGAFRKRLFSRRLTRSSVRQAVEMFALENGYTNITDFPLLCLNQTQTDTLLDLSLKMEQEMTLSDFFESPKGKENLKKFFHELVQANKFCSVHVDLLLQEEEWIRFFQTRMAYG